MSILTWAQEQGFTGLLHGHQHRPFFATIHLADQKGGPLFIAGSPSAACNDLPPQTQNGYQWLLVDGSRIVISTRLLTNSYRFENYKDDVEFICEPSGTFSSTAIPRARPSREPSPTERRSITKAAAEDVLNTIRPTYGPTGGIRGLIRISGVEHVRDGFQIVHSIHTYDPIERRIVDVFSSLAKEVTERTGDGRKTAAIICAETLNKALSFVVGGAIEIKLADGIMEGARLASEYIHQVAKFPGTKEDACLIAAKTSAIGFPEIGATVQDAVKKAGHRGKIIIEKRAPCEKVQLKLISIPPFTFPLPQVPRWLDIIFAEDPYVLNNPAIITYNGKISNFREILHLLEYGRESNRPLIFLCQEITDEAAAAVEQNFEKNILVALPAMYEAPSQQMYIKDIALITQARYLSISKGDRLSSLLTDQLGRCEKITINADGMTFHKPPVTQGSLNKYLNQLEKQSKNINDISDRQLFKNRIACMSKGLLKIIFNGRSAPEAELLHSLIRDALKSSQAAIQAGLVPGAGSVYLLAAKYIRQAGSFTEQVGQGIEAFASGLEAPLKTIAENNNTSSVTKVIDALIGSEDQYYNGEQVAPWKGGVPSEPATTAASVITLSAEAAARILKTVSWEQSQISEK